MPLITQGLYALFFWYGMRYAYKHMITEVFLTVYMERQDRSCQIYMKSVI